MCFLDLFLAGRASGLGCSRGKKCPSAAGESQGMSALIHTLIFFRKNTRDLQAGSIRIIKIKILLSTSY